MYKHMRRAHWSPRVHAAHLGMIHKHVSLCVLGADGLHPLRRYAGYDLITNVSFVVFTATWIAMRNVYLPFWVIRSVLFDAWDAIVGEGHYVLFPHWELFTGLLVFLALLHVFWSYVIIKIAVEAVGKGTPDDTREKVGAHEE